MNKITDTSVFLTPLLDINSKIFEQKIRTKDGFQNSRFFNSFILDEVIDLYRDYHIFLVHYATRDIKYEEFNNIIESCPNYKDSYEEGGQNLVVRIIELPDKFKPEYDLFRNGQYSKFSKEAKMRCISNALVNTLNGQPLKGMLEAIFKINPALAQQLKNSWIRSLKLDYMPDDQELWHNRNEREETLTSELKIAWQRKYSELHERQGME